MPEKNTWYYMKPHVLFIITGKLIGNNMLCRLAVLNSCHLKMTSIYEKQKNAKETKKWKQENTNL